MRDGVKAHHLFAIRTAAERDADCDHVALVVPPNGLGHLPNPLASDSRAFATGRVEAHELDVADTGQFGGMDPLAGCARLSGHTGFVHQVIREHSGAVG